MLNILRFAFSGLILLLVPGCWEQGVHDPTNFFKENRRGLENIAASLREGGIRTADSRPYKETHRESTNEQDEALYNSIQEFSKKNGMLLIEIVRHKDGTPRKDVSVFFNLKQKFGMGGFTHYSVVYSDEGINPAVYFHEAKCDPYDQVWFFCISKPIF